MAHPPTENLSHGHTTVLTGKASATVSDLIGNERVVKVSMKSLLANFENINAFQWKHNLL